MASFLLNFTTILSLLLVLFPLLLLAPPSTASPGLRSRFLTDIDSQEIKCMPNDGTCDNMWLNNGTEQVQHVFCCKKHCRNVLQDRNNCGACLNKCQLGYLCCNGNCTNIAYDPMHCGKCHKTCNSDGQKCEYGTCGYA